MRVAIFSDNFYPELGGIQDSIALLGREFSRLGHDVDYFVPKAAERDFRKARVPFGEIRLGEHVRVHRLFSLPFPSPTQQSRLVVPTGLRSRVILRAQPDVIHTHTFFGVGLEAIAAAKILHLPLVGTNHWAVSEFAHYSFLNKKSFAGISRRYVSWYYNHCDFVTAPSESVINEMREFNFRKPAEVISNPVDTETFHLLDVSRSALKKKFELSDATIVFAGRLGKEKKVDVILRAVAKVKTAIPAITFAIAGHGSERESLKELARTLGIEKNVIFTGTLDKTTLAELYRASEIFVIMSTSETQSMVLLQAMACGLPAIGARWRALPEYITPRTGMLVEPGDEETLAQKIIFLLKHPSERAKLRKGSLKFSHEFSAPLIAKQWERIYEETIRNYAKAQ